ncbi:MAG: peptidase M61 [Sphingobacteriaceae bacterium]|nr:peptidase M61 [Sphingobacteriaceae bacterium]
MLLKKSYQFLFCTFILLTGACIAQNDYLYKIDLNKVVDDKLLVELTPPKTDKEEVRFCFPAMVPGTYEVYNFGRFISDLKVTGKNGVKIKIEKKSDNIYVFSPAKEIETITYMVEDTWDTKIKEKVVFEPGGTNIEEGKNFSINTHGFFGFYEGMMDRNFVLEFAKPLGFYPATGLSNVTVGKEKDVISVMDYHDLVDSPIMYCIPDTTIITVANTKVLVALYSPNKKINSTYITKTIQEILYAQRDYLGGELPVDKYAFLIYFIDRPTLSGAHGALEHSYSSFYVMPEMDSIYLDQQIRDVAAHEFFHIVTPLNIHANEIGNFDYINPKMSEHLWLYEGMTEYAAHHAQVKAGLIDVDEFLKTMMGKYENSTNDFNDTMSFTFMSKNVLNEKIHPQYNNVYEKGALIGMCLDIYLRHYSDGKYGTQNLMKDLAKKYGKKKSFNDEDLFAEIEKLTYPEIGTFLKKHVSGKEPLPIKDVFDKVGLEFEKEKTYQNFSLGGFDVGFNDETKRLIIVDIANMDSFGKAMNYKIGDEILSLNGTVISIENIKSVFGQFFDTVKEGDLVKLEVMRPKRKKKFKKTELKATARKVEQKEYNIINVKKPMSDKEKVTFKGWLDYNFK